MVNKGHKLTEEHKKKISDSMKGKTLPLEVRKKISDTCKEKGIKPKKIFYAEGYNHPSYKNGTGMLKKILLKYNRDISRCQCCKDTNKLVIHHIDGNRKNNHPKNLGIVCTYCHYAMHNNPNKIKNRFQEGHPRNKHYLEVIQ